MVSLRLRCLVLLSWPCPPFLGVPTKSLTGWLAPWHPMCVQGILNVLLLRASVFQHLTPGCVPSACSPSSSCHYKAHLKRTLVAYGPGLVTHQWETRLLGRDSTHRGCPQQHLVLLRMTPSADSTPSQNCPITACPPPPIFPCEVPARSKAPKENIICC